MENKVSDVLHHDYTLNCCCQQNSDSSQILIALQQNATGVLSRKYFHIQCNGFPLFYCKLVPVNLLEIS